MSADVLTPIVDDAPVRREGRSPGSRIWGWVWPKLMAIAIVLALWELLYLILVTWTGKRRCGSSTNHSA